MVPDVIFLGVGQCCFSELTIKHVFGIAIVDHNSKPSLQSMITALLGIDRFDSYMLVCFCPELRK